MFDFVHDHKGSISVFVLAVMLPVMIISFVLADFARAMAVRAQAAAVSETYANSYMSVYDELLNDVYGLFSVSQSEEGKQALDSLKKYMEAAYNPYSRNSTGTTGSYQLSEAVYNLINKHTADYPDALSLTGGALAKLNAAVSGDEGADAISNRNLGNNDELMMQICEYVKYIGPTEIVMSGALSKILTSDVEGSGMEETRKNYEIIEEKKRVDASLQTISDGVQELYNAMKAYDDAVADLHERARNGAEGSVATYQNAIKKLHEGINGTGGMIALINEFKESHKPKKEESSGSGTTDTNNENSGVLTFDEMRRLRDVCYSQTGFMPYIDLFYYDPYTNAGFPDITNRPEDFFYGLNGMGLMNYTGSNYTTDYMKMWVDDYFVDCNTCSYGTHDVLNCQNEGKICFNYDHIDRLRQEICSKARALQGYKGDYAAKVNALIERAGEGSELAEGIRKDYENLLTDPNNQMYYVMNYDYGEFANEFSADMTDKNNLQIMKNDFLNVYNALGEYDDEIKAVFDEAGSIYIKLVGSEDGSITGSDVTKIDTSALKQKMNQLPGKTTVASEQAFINSRSEFGFASFNRGNIDSYLADYYKNFDEREGFVYSTDKGSVGISKIYEIFSKWSTAPSEEAQAEKDKLDKLKDDLTNMINEMSGKDDLFPNIKVRCKRELCLGKEEGSAERITLTDLLEENNKDFDSLKFNSESGESGISSFGNKLMLMMYNYGMLTSQTSDFKENDDGDVERVQPESYQGIMLAANKDKSDDDYEFSETNFLLYGEMEYIFGGQKSSEDNFTRVRNNLAIIRFVPNYLSTYQIKEIKTIMTAINSALSWCPLAAILVTQALRIAIASLETWCDLDLLYGGHSVKFMPKTKINEMSFVEKLKNYSKDMFDRLNDVDKSSSLDAPSSGDSDNDLKLSYQQYLILLQMLFVGSEAMVNRTRDIIEVNMNFIKNINVSDNGDVKTLTIDDKSWRAEKAKTAVMVTCTTNSEFIFIGKLFHLDNTEYEFVADGAEQIGQTEYKSASVIKSY